MTKITQKQADVMQMNTAELLIDSVERNLFEVAIQLCVDRESVLSPFRDSMENQLTFKDRSFINFTAEKQFASHGYITNTY